MQLDRALSRAADHLLERQSEDGSWVYELGCDVSVTAESLYLRHLLDRVDRHRQEGVVKWLLSHQRADGAWAIFFGGPAEVNVTLKSYLALKLAGVPEDSEPMVKARQAVLAMGGVEACHLFTKIYLAWGGLYSWERLPHIPIEILRLPKWLFSRYDLSYWARTILVPLLVTLAHRPVFPVGVRIDELATERPDVITMPSGLPRWQEKLVFAAEAVLERYGRQPFKPWRRAALSEAERWTVDRFADSDGLGAIWPAMVNAAVALICQGHRPDSPALVEALKQIDALEQEDSAGIRVEPCVSPVWDTVWVMMALLEAGLDGDHPALERAGRWLLDRQALKPGDWVHGVEGRLAPGGWYFQYRNEFYPDVDDTAVALMVLERLGMADEPEVQRRIQLGRDWIVGMQNRDGGWGAFDRTPRRREWLNAFSWARPFDGALLDPSTADVSARCLEALARHGEGRTPVAARAMRYLSSEQEPDGAWFGRWGVNYVYGTWSVLSALGAQGQQIGERVVDRGVGYLEATQLSDGGWGETCETYTVPVSRGSGPSTPSQTAWALLGLHAVGAGDRPAAAGGLSYLLERQTREGSWHEEDYTGAGFPRVFYLQYGGYSEIFPTLALARYRQLVARGALDTTAFREALV